MFVLFYSVSFFTIIILNVMSYVIVGDSHVDNLNYKNKIAVRGSTSEYWLSQLRQFENERNAVICLGANDTYSPEETLKNIQKIAEIFEYAYVVEPPTRPNLKKHLQSAFKQRFIPFTLEGDVWNADKIHLNDIGSKLFLESILEHINHRKVLVDNYSLFI